MKIKQTISVQIQLRKAAFIICLLFVCLDFVCSDSSSLETIVIGGIDDNKPYAYFDTRGTRSGYNVDLINALEKVTRFRFIYKPLSREAFYESLVNQEVNMVIGVQYDAEYVDRLIFSKPLIKNQFSIFVRSAEKDIKDIHDLNGKKVAVYKYDPAYQHFKNADNVRVFVAESQRDAYLLLKSYAVDAFVANKNAAISYIEDSIEKGNLMVVGQPYTVVPSAFVALEAKDDLINEINLGIDTLRSTGVLDRLQEKWFGETVGDRSLFWIRLTIAVLAVGFLLMIAVMVVTRINRLLKRQVQQRTEKIREEIRHKEAIVESLFDFLVILDEDLVVLSVNSRIENSSWIADKNILGKPFESTGLGRLVDFSDIETACCTGNKLLNQERTVVSGKKKWCIEYNISPIVVDDMIKGVTIALKDVTEERQMRHKIAHQDKMESLGRLIASIAHEIRNPLASIDMYAKLIPEKLDNPEFRSHLIKDIPNEIDRLNNLVSYLLDYSSPKPSTKVTFMIGGELETVIRLLRTKLDEGNIRLMKGFDHGPSVYFDIQHFRQILFNVMTNGIEATSGENEPMISIQIDSQGDYCRMVVSNNGPPMDRETMERAFEPFFSTKSNGYGLGLSVVLQLCRENGAEVMIDPTFEGGTQLIFKIPMVEGSSA